MAAPAVLVQEILNAVPLTRTPWGGRRILSVKHAVLERRSAEDEALAAVVAGGRVGESWEISTGNSFPSRLRDRFEGFDRGTPLQSVLASRPALLGTSITSRVGAHSPLLLKWLHAQDVLSLQVHPARGDRRLQAHEEGKPESWLVMDVEEDGALYLGFRSGVTRDDVVAAFGAGREREVLLRFKPRPGDYISVPPGCVHAIDAGVLLAEPQFVMPGREGVTLRVSDWGRRYNGQGELDPAGQPRATHWERALDTIDWSLPQGEDLLRQLVRPLDHGQPYHPGAATPFPVVAYFSPGEFCYQGLVPDAYGVVTVWGGQMILSTPEGAHVLAAGESAFIAATEGRVALPFRLQSGADGGCGAAFFSIDLS